MARNLYSIEVRVYATVYVVAEDEDDAFAKVATLYGDSVELAEDLHAELPIYGGDFDSPDLPEISLSPAMTISGVDDLTQPDLVHEFEEA